MKIDKTRLNYIYDQYSNEENRLTHALLHTIASSKNIFYEFLKNFICIKKLYISGSFEFSTQKVPFNHGDNDSEKIKSIPDGWIIDEQNDLGIAIEVKDKKNNIRLNQLKSHIKRIESYNHSYLLVFTPDTCKPEKLTVLDEFDYSDLEIIWKSWDQIYWWLKHLQTKSLNRKDIFLLQSMMEYL